MSYAALKAEALACGVELLLEDDRRSCPANRRQKLYSVNDRVFGINRRLSCVFGRRSSDLVVDEETNRNFKEHYDKLEEFDINERAKDDDQPQQTEYVTRTTQFIVAPQGHNTFSEDATTITITDESGGEFVVVETKQ